MYKKICITDRHLTRDGLPAQMQRVLAAEPDLVILREKDLDDAAYRALAEAVLAQCRAAGVPCWFHGRDALAAALGADGLQVSFGALTAREGLPFATKPLGVSVHAVAEAQVAERLGADCLIYGHVFPTDCKPGLPPRGLDALRAVADSVGIPVFAIGGITEENTADCLAAGAAGVCRMSGYMQL